MIDIRRICMSLTDLCVRTARLTLILFIMATAASCHTAKNTEYSSNVELTDSTTMTSKRYSSISAVTSLKSEISDSVVITADSVFLWTAQGYTPNKNDSSKRETYPTFRCISARRITIEKKNNIVNNDLSCMKNDAVSDDHMAEVYSGSEQAFQKDEPSRGHPGNLHLQMIIAAFIFSIVVLYHVRVRQA